MLLAALAGCGGGADPRPPAAPRLGPLPLPRVTLTAEDRTVWAAAPARHDRVPVLPGSSHERSRTRALTGGDLHAWLVGA